MEDLEKLPTKGTVSRPTSGTYGEKAAVDDLKSALPPMSAPPPPGAGGPPGTVRPTPVRPPGSAGMLGGAGTPPGLPDLLSAPTKYPDRPVAGSPGDALMPAPAAAVGAQQQRLAVLDALIRSPNVAEQTKEWATVVRRTLIGA